MRRFGTMGRVFERRWAFGASTAITFALLLSATTASDARGEASPRTAARRPAPSATHAAAKRPTARVSRRTVLTARHASANAESQAEPANTGTAAVKSAEAKTAEKKIADARIAETKATESKAAGIEHETPATDPKPNAAEEQAGPKPTAADPRSGAKPRAARDPHPVARRAAPKVAPPCFHTAIQLERGFGAAETARVPLTQCSGAIAEQGIEELSILARPMSARRPVIPAVLPQDNPPPRATTIVAGLAAGHAAGGVTARPAATTHPAAFAYPNHEWAPGVKMVDPGLVARLQRVVDHFGPRTVTVVSGYRPASLGSFHQSARALDFHLSGIRNEALVAFCRTLPDTGCGYYPNSSFVHMDVRPEGTGHVFWIDASGPGEPAQYVASWPPPQGPSRSNAPDAAPADEPTDGSGALARANADSAFSILVELTDRSDDATSANRELGLRASDPLEL